MIRLIRRLYWLAKRQKHFRQGRPMLARYQTEIAACFAGHRLAFKPNLDGFGLGYVYTVLADDKPCAVLRIVPD